MKIAVAADGNTVSEHFGYCANFTVVTAENGTVIKRETIVNPSHKPGFLPEFLSGLGVNAVIAGGMGGNAVRLFEEKGIEVVTGASGPIDKAVENYLGGRLTSSGSACHEHMHSDECGGHEHQ